MNKSYSVSLSDDLLTYAERFVAEGSAKSVEDLLIAALEELKRDQEAAVRQFTEGHGLEELKRRLDTPREEFVEWDGDEMLAEAERFLDEHLDAKKLAAE